MLRATTQPLGAPASLQCSARWRALPRVRGPDRGLRRSSPYDAQPHVLGQWLQRTTPRQPGDPRWGAGSAQGRAVPSPAIAGESVTDCTFRRVARPRDRPECSKGSPALWRYNPRRVPGSVHQCAMGFQAQTGRQRGLKLVFMLAWRPSSTMGSNVPEPESTSALTRGAHWLMKCAPHLRG